MWQLIIITLLLLLIGAAAMALMLDARQRRIDRHVETALSTSQPEIQPSVRRELVQSEERFFHQLFHYHPGMTYVLRPAFVLLAGVVAAAGIFHANSFLQFSPVHVALAAVFTAMLVVRGLFGWQRRRFVDQLFRQLPDTLEMVISSVRSGLPVNEAFRTVSCQMPQPTAGQFAIVCSEISLGRPIEEAMEGVYWRTHVAEYGFFAVTLAVQMKSGGGLVETLRTLGDTVRQRVTLAARAKALAGEVIFSSRALSVAPFILGVMLYLINPRLVDLLFYDPTGRNLLAYAIGSVVVGTLVIRWIVRRNTAL